MSKKSDYFAVFYACEFCGNVMKTSLSRLIENIDSKKHLDLIDYQSDETHLSCECPKCKEENRLLLKMEVEN
ncbi:hypothetical protein LS70_003780 [Helicobacter sp. MIT 11-5569]|uniref:hypothetical protein n=1 Tax=Helicobacter sp. MIT 11-5569 TaxID=1548151 RepID=UPI00051FAF88|nr:hypothetical protein [Helicobacter sp. MIT 11-5569]TLD83938.1 hypothetical protein LS70_003780 [Helicobacter sp. MIT 11-5569]